MVSRPDLLGLPTDWDLGRIVRLRTADTILEVMASSMLTFVGVVFALTLVGLQLASSQLSPRVIRTFVRSGVTKAAFGVFLANFAFAVTALAFDNLDDGAAASRTIMAAVALLALAVGVFVVYVTSTMRLLEVGWVITAVANEARDALRKASPAGRSLRRGRRSGARPGIRAWCTCPPSTTGGTRASSGPCSASIGHASLAWPRSTAASSRSFRGWGSTSPRVDRCSRCTEARSPDDDRLLACLDLGRSRTLYQDPSFGIRQLVDVATQALSPAINQPSTAVQVIDRLHDLLLRIARAPVPTGFHADAAGVVRLVEPTLTPAHLLLLAYQEISQLGASLLARDPAAGSGVRRPRRRGPGRAGSPR